MISSIFRNTSESESEVIQSCLILCDPKDYSLPDSSVHGIFQAWILKWVVISFFIRNHVLKPRAGIISSKVYKQLKTSQRVLVFWSVFIHKNHRRKTKGRIILFFKKKKKKLTFVWPLVCVIILDVQRQVTARNW